MNFDNKVTSNEIDLFSCRYGHLPILQSHGRLCYTEQIINKEVLKSPHVMWQLHHYILASIISIIRYT